MKEKIDNDKIIDLVIDDKKKLRQQLIQYNVTKREFIEALYEFYESDDYIRNKYNKAGIYSISIDDKIVYIGKSTDMMQRTAQHFASIFLDTKTHKYKIMYEAMMNDIPIRFDVLYHSDQTDKEAIFVDIGYQEAIWINELQPPLNYQLPKLHNYKSFTINKKAQVITLDEILQH